ncbi:MAG: ribosome maturation factor RimM [Bacteroidales bacterium]|nr:ribosome maturation factor RimM [Bacteroidales bacterium]MCF8400961.1 ribosome maturation factor RimM [Bacteroidales bacterium]
MGRILKQHNRPGVFSVMIEADDPTRYSGIDAVFVEINHTLIPFFLEQADFEKSNKTITLDEAPDPDIAELLIGSDLYLPNELLPELKGNQFYFHEVKGFEVIDKKHGRLGPVKEVLELPQQSVFQVDHKGKIVLVPINDEIIQKVDRDKKEILVSTPEGLLELYL